LLNAGVTLNYFQQYASTLPSIADPSQFAYVVPYGSAGSSWRPLDRVWSLSRTLGELNAQTRTTVPWDRFALLLPGSAIPPSAYRWVPVDTLLNGRLSVDQLYQTPPVSVSQPIVQNVPVQNVPVQNIQYNPPNNPYVPVQNTQYNPPNNQTAPVPNISPLTPERVFHLWQNARWRIDHTCEPYVPYTRTGFLNNLFNREPSPPNLADLAKADQLLYDDIKDTRLDNNPSTGTPIKNAYLMFDYLVDVDMFNAIRHTANPSRLLPLFTGWKRLMDLNDPRCSRAFIINFDWSWLVGQQNTTPLRIELEQIKQRLWRHFQATQQFPQEPLLLRIMSVDGGIISPQVAEAFDINAPRSIGDLVLSYPVKNPVQGQRLYQRDTVHNIRSILATEKNPEQWPFTTDFAATFCARYGNQDTCQQCSKFNYVSVVKANKHIRKVQLCDECRCQTPSNVQTNNANRHVRFASRPEIQESDVYPSLRSRTRSRSRSRSPIVEEPENDPDLESKYDSDPDSDPDLESKYDSDPDSDPDLESKYNERSRSPSPDRRNNFSIRSNRSRSSDFHRPEDQPPDHLVGQVNVHVNGISSQLPVESQQRLQPLQDIMALQTAMLRLLLGRPLDQPSEQLLRQALGSQDLGTLDTILQNARANVSVPTSNLTAQQIADIVGETYNRVSQNLQSQINQLNQNNNNRAPVPSVSEAQILEITNRATELANASWRRELAQTQSELRSAQDDLRQAISRIQNNPVSSPSVNDIVQAIDASPGLQLSAPARAVLVNEILNQIRTTQALVNPQQLKDTIQEVLSQQPPHPTDSINSTTLNDLTRRIDSISQSLLTRDAQIQNTIRQELAQSQLSSTQLNNAIAQIASIVNASDRPLDNTEIREQVRRASVQSVPSVSNQRPSADQSVPIPPLTASQLSQAFAEQLNDIQTVLESPEFAQQISAQITQIVQARENDLVQRVENVLKSSPVQLDGASFVQLVNDRLGEILPNIVNRVQDQLQNLRSTLPSRPGVQDIEQTPLLQYLIQRLEAEPVGSNTPITVERIRQIASEYRNSSSGSESESSVLSSNEVETAIQNALNNFIRLQNQRFETQLLHASQVEQQLADITIQLEQLQPQSQNPQTDQLVQTAISQINQLPRQLIVAILGQVDGLNDDTPPAQVIELARNTSRQWREQQERHWVELAEQNRLLTQAIQTQSIEVQTLTGQTRVLTTQIQNLLSQQTLEFNNQRTDLQQLRQRVDELPEQLRQARPDWVTEIQTQVNQEHQQLKKDIFQELKDFETRLRASGYSFVNGTPPNINPNQPTSPNDSDTMQISNVDAETLEARVNQLQEENERLAREQQNQLNELEQARSQIERLETLRLSTESQLQAVSERREQLEQQVNQLQLQAQNATHRVLELVNQLNSLNSQSTTDTNLREQLTKQYQEESQRAQQSETQAKAYQAQLIEIQGKYDQEVQQLRIVNDQLQNQFQNQIQSQNQIQNNHLQTLHQQTVEQNAHIAQLKTEVQKAKEGILNQPPGRAPKRARSSTKPPAPSQLPPTLPAQSNLGIPLRGADVKRVSISPPAPQQNVQRAPPIEDQAMPPLERDDEEEQKIDLTLYNTDQDYRDRVLTYLKAVQVDDPINEDRDSVYKLRIYDILPLVNDGLNELDHEGVLQRRQFVERCQQYWNLARRSPAVLRFFSYSWHPNFRYQFPQYGRLFTRMLAQETVLPSRIWATETNDTEILLTDAIERFREPQWADKGSAHRLLNELKVHGERLIATANEGLATIKTSDPLQTDIYTLFTTKPDPAPLSEQFRVSPALRAVHVSTTTRQFVFGPFTGVNENDNTTITNRLSQRLIADPNDEKTPGIRSVLIAQVGQTLLVNTDKLQQLMNNNLLVNRLLGIPDNQLIDRTVSASSFVLNVGMVRRDRPSISVAFHIGRDLNNIQQQTWFVQTTTTSNTNRLLARSAGDAVRIAVENALTSLQNEPSNPLICLSCTIQTNTYEIVLASFAEQTSLTECIERKPSNGQKLCFDQRGMNNIHFRQRIYLAVRRIVDRINSDVNSRGVPAYPEFVSVCAPVLCRPDMGTCFSQDSSEYDTADSLNEISQNVKVFGNVSTVFVHVELSGNTRNPDVSPPIPTRQGIVQWRYVDLHRWIVEVDTLWKQKKSEPQEVNQLLRAILNWNIGVFNLESQMMAEADTIRQRIKNEENNLPAYEFKELQTSVIRKIAFIDKTRLPERDRPILVNGVNQTQTAEQLASYLRNTALPQLGALTLGAVFTELSIEQGKTANNLNKLTYLLDVLMRAQTDIPIAGLDFLDAVAKLGAGHSMCMFTDEPVLGLLDLPDKVHHVSRSAFNVVASALKTLFAQ
jgi:hypothetical protein